MSVASEAIAAAFLAACGEELRAPKPGNIHIFAAGHGWAVEDFERAAEAAAPWIAQNASVGRRILGAVEASLASVGHNANLGIILFCAPLACAAEAPGRDLRARLVKVLATLDAADAADVFRAIALAAPGGLGRVARHDVHAPVNVTLQEAMREAAPRDLIARQYANGFADVFETGLPALEAAQRRWRSPPWAGALDLYLTWLAGFPDTHIERKHGAEAARDVQAQARLLHAGFAACGDPLEKLPELMKFDAELKRRGLNPGTSADLTVATLFAQKLIRLSHAGALPWKLNND